RATTPTVLAYQRVVSRGRGRSHWLQGWMCATCRHSTTWMVRLPSYSHLIISEGMRHAEGRIRGKPLDGTFSGRH
ncbi:hypothetical protein BO71DRAFT_278974, partial [Aspergillus ellipticus CBS 707.79]